MISSRFYWISKSLNVYFLLFRGFPHWNAAPLSSTASNETFQAEMFQIALPGGMPLG